MARIRSVHPGQWTDEAFVACGAWARLLAIAVRNEADDNGVFEWKPLVLKMRLFPADAVDVAALLAELEGAGIVKRVEQSGKDYGLIRNFRRYQRPDKPKSQHPLADEHRQFVGIVADNSTTETQPEAVNSGNSRGTVGDESGSGRGFASQRKEEGGNRNRKREEEWDSENKSRGAADAAETRGARLKIEALPDEWRAFCRANRRDLDPDRTWQRFSDYWTAQPGARGRKVDWAATWRNWVRDERPPAGAPPQSKPNFSKIAGTG